MSSSSKAPFIAAKTLGAFSGSGLDVTIDRGTGSQKTIELVATGTYDLGYGDINSMIEYNVKNPGNPLVGVYMVLNTPPFSLLSLKKYGVNSQDLKGLNRRRWRRAAALAHLRQERGLAVDSVTWTNMAPPCAEPALVKGDKAISVSTSRF
jgi:NitT/TauT family transport system substrate-binding protein